MVAGSNPARGATPAQCPEPYPDRFAILTAASFWAWAIPDELERIPTEIAWTYENALGKDTVQKLYKRAGRVGGTSMNCCPGTQRSSLSARSSRAIVGLLQDVILPDAFEIDVRDFQRAFDAKQLSQFLHREQGALLAAACAVPSTW